MPIYEYICARNHVTERLGRREETSASCSVCDAPAQRSAVNMVAIAQYEPVKETRSDVRSFQEASMEVDYSYTRAENDGIPVKRPDLWKQAKREAKKKGMI